jgi:hypothetical protein
MYDSLRLFGHRALCWYRSMYAPGYNQMTVQVLDIHHRFINIQDLL